MSQSKTQTWASWVAGLSALGLVAGVTGCGKSMTTESGETHFVVCKTEQDCSGTRGATGCDGGYCVDQNGDKIGVSSSSPPDPGPAACASCGDSECGTPGSCSLEAACKVVDCDSAIFDDQACVRPSCTTDADCLDDERCAWTYLSRHYQCEQKGATCECTAGNGLFPMNLCSPVALAGPRGAWQSIVVSDDVIGMTTQRSITPDGAIIVQNPDEGMGTPAPEQKQLSADDLMQLQQLIDGTSFRHDLADPKACEPAKSRDVIVELTLDTTSLSKNIMGCLSEVGTFSVLMDIVQRY